MNRKVNITYRDNMDSYRQWENQKIEDHKRAVDAFTKRENDADRAANIKLLKAFGRVFLKCLVIALLAWAFLATWQERLPK